MGRKLIDKKLKKLADKKCYFCPEENYVVLDVHRIHPGEDGGRYTNLNTITVCCKCHRLINAGEIVTERKYLSSNGKWVLKYFEGGVEKWL